MILLDSAVGGSGSVRGRLSTRLYCWRISLRRSSGKESSISQSISSRFRFPAESFQKSLMAGGGFSIDKFAAPTLILRQGVSDERDRESGLMNSHVDIKVLIISYDSLSPQQIVKQTNGNLVHQQIGPLSRCLSPVKDKSRHPG